MPASKEGKLASQAAHIQRLLDKFGNPQEWEFTGEVTEHPAGPLGPTMQCSCGHGITEAFWWKRKDDPEAKKKLPTGCVCVEQLPGIQPGELAKLQAEIKRLEAKRAEARKKSKAAADTDLVQACLRKVTETFDARCRRVEERRAEGQWLPPEDYTKLEDCRDARGEVAKAAKLKTPAAQIKAMSRSVHRLTSATPPAECDGPSERKVRAWLDSGAGRSCRAELERVTLEAKRALREAPPDTTEGKLYAQWSDEQKRVRRLRVDLEMGISEAMRLSPTTLLFENKDAAEAEARMSKAIQRLGGNGCPR